MVAQFFIILSKNGLMSSSRAFNSNSAMSASDAMSLSSLSWIPNSFTHRLMIALDFLMVGAAAAFGGVACLGGIFFSNVESVVV